MAWHWRFENLDLRPAASVGLNSPMRIDDDGFALGISDGLMILLSCLGVRQGYLPQIVLNC